MSIAFVYPGQGSLRAGMATQWSGHAAGRVFDEVGESAELDLARLADDATTASSTAAAQPAIFAASLAANQALSAAGVVPDVVAGHSLGELTAAVGAGVWTTQAGARIVAARGRAMRDACQQNPGAMAAVLRLDDDVVDQLVATVDGVVVANENAPGQTVVSGTPEAVDLLSEHVRAAGGRVVALDVEGAFHSPAMASAQSALAEAIAAETTTDPRIPLVTGTSAQPLRNANVVTAAVIDGVLLPVRWRDVQRRLESLGVELIIEVGPGGVLAGLAKRTIPDIRVVTVAGPDDIDTAAAAAAEVDTISVPDPAAIRS